MWNDRDRCDWTLKGTELYKFIKRQKMVVHIAQVLFCYIINTA